MTLTGEHEQIKTAYETCNMSPEQIAQDRGLELTAVKAALMQCSSLYRKDCGREDEDADDLNFNNDDLRAVNQEIKNLALYAEDPNLRARMCTYIRDDKKGRRDAAKIVQGQTFNILTFNEHIAKVRHLAEKAKQTVIDVTSSSNNSNDKQLVNG